MAELIGRKIKDIRFLTDQEMADEYWDGRRCIALELDDGTLLYPSQDDEGNGPGALFGKAKAGGSFYVTRAEVRQDG